MRGNHHDAWVAGASDPVSGMVAVLEEARVIGMLAREGWKPRRTLVFAAWDAEEPGLLGSTEWVEDLADTLSAKVVAYVNSDSNARGFFDAGGSHSLERFVNEIARDVPDPKVKGSIADRLLARTILQGSATERRIARDERRFEIDALGSGSDYTPFLQHLGIASLSLGFGGEGEYGQYHSVYDSVDHYLRFQDPDLAYAAALAKVGGRAVLRLSEADLLPFDFARAADRIGRYVDEVGELLKTLKTDTAEHNRRVDEGAFTLAANPTETWIAPKKKDEVPDFDLEPLRQAVERLRVAARRFDAAARTTGDVPATALAAANAIVFQAERALTRPDGLPRRPWFRHQVYAPGFYTGYGVKTLPAVREALEQRAWDEARAQIPAGGANAGAVRRRDRASGVGAGAVRGRPSLRPRDAQLDRPVSAACRSRCFSLDGIRHVPASQEPGETGGGAHVVGETPGGPPRRHSRVLDHMAMKRHRRRHGRPAPQRRSTRST